MTNTLDDLRLRTYSVSKGALWALFAPLAAPPRGAGRPDGRGG